MDIMKEMLRNGPVSVEFEATSKLTGWSLYREGIMTKHGMDSLMKEKIKASLSADDLESMTT